MAELAIHKGTSVTPQTPSRLEEGRPLRYLRDLLKWDPFGEMTPLRLFEPNEAITPLFDIKETPHAFVFKADVPGFHEKDIEITTQNDQLNVSGSRREQREEKGETYYVCERRFGNFSRSFTLPQGSDENHVTADLKNGILTVTVPRVAAPPAKKIPVKTVTVKA